MRHFLLFSFALIGIFNMKCGIYNKPKGEMKLKKQCWIIFKKHPK